MDVRSLHDLELECGGPADFDGPAVAVLAAADEDPAGVEGEDVGDGEAHGPVLDPRPGFHVPGFDMHHPKQIRLIRGHDASCTRSNSVGNAARFSSACKYFTPSRKYP